MNNTSAAPAAGFHAGELAVQHRAGVRAAAERLAAMLDTPDLRGSIGRFLTAQSFAAITGRDRAGRLWISPLTGPRGLLEVTGSTSVRVHTTPAPGDPLHRLPAGQPVGLLAIEFARRRRVRVNGHLTAAGDDGLTVHVDQAYGNCPQYIQQRTLQPGGPAVPADAAVRNADVLSPVDADLIRSADTFLLGTTHPDHGSDASHRGGPPGFVRVEDDHNLWWPDYPGNNMFNSLGNLTVDPAAALLFIDFTTGMTLRLSGAAQLDWAAPRAGDDAHTGRRVRFTVTAVTAGPSIPSRAADIHANPHNPPLTNPSPTKRP